MSRQQSLSQTFGAPLLIAVLSLCGLISALLADGVWDVTSWLCLAAPTVIGLWALLPHRIRT